MNITLNWKLIIALVNLEDLKELNKRVEKPFNDIDYKISDTEFLKIAERLGTAYSVGATPVGTFSEVVAQVLPFIESINRGEFVRQPMFRVDLKPSKTLARLLIVNPIDDYATDVKKHLY